MNAIDRLIMIAERELGYLEKKSNKDLDDKTANAGSGNYTKYNRDMRAWAGSAGLDDQWCQNFVDWLFVEAYGQATAFILLGKFTNYTPTGADQFKKRGAYIRRGKGTPRRGDVIYFYSTAKGRIGHVGIVTEVTSSKVYTIEGNTSGASKLITNGGGVRAKSYLLTSSYIDGYGRPDYSKAAGDYAVPTPRPEPVYRLGERTLCNYTEGADVKELQEALISLGYSCGSYGADGEFGDCTEMAVLSFQAGNGLPRTGKYTEADHAALSALLDARAAEPPADPSEAWFVEVELRKRCYVRTGPGTEYPPICVAFGGDRLEYLGHTSENGWHLVNVDGGTGYVSGKYTKLVM